MSFDDIQFVRLPFKPFYIHRHIGTMERSMDHGLTSPPSHKTLTQSIVWPGPPLCNRCSVPPPFLPAPSPTVEHRDHKDTPRPAGRGLQINHQSININCKLHVTLHKTFRILAYQSVPLGTVFLRAHEYDVCHWIIHSVWLGKASSRSSSS